MRKTNELMENAYMLEERRFFHAPWLPLQWTFGLLHQLVELYPKKPIPWESIFREFKYSAISKLALCRFTVENLRSTTALLLQYKCAVMEPINFLQHNTTKKNTPIARTVHVLSRQEKIMVSWIVCIQAFIIEWETMWILFSYPNMESEPGELAGNNDSRIPTFIPSNHMAIPTVVSKDDNEWWKQQATFLQK